VRVPPLFEGTPRAVPDRNKLGIWGLGIAGLGISGLGLLGFHLCSPDLEGGPGVC
jgi:hypothetical protein